MHRDIATKITELREMRSKYDDSRYAPRLQAYPPVHGNPPRRGRLPRLRTPSGQRRSSRCASFRATSAQSASEAKSNPQAALPHADQKWWRLAQFDSVLVSSADGSGAAWLRRDPAQFRSIMRRSTILHARLAREWEHARRHVQGGRPDDQRSRGSGRKTFAAVRGHASDAVTPAGAG